MSREELLIKIQDILAILTHKIDIANSNHELNVNIHAENIFAKVLSVIFDVEFKNANYEKSSNFPSIDLFDASNRIAVQITSTSSKTKVNNTLKKFFDNNLENEFDTLYMYLLKEKGSYDKKQIDRIVRNKIKFDINKHILSKEDIYKELNRQNDLAKMQEVYDILQEEYHFLENSFYQPMNVAISFAENDIDIAIEIIKELNKKKITVFSNSSNLKSRLIDLNNGYIKFILNSVPKEIDFYFAIITDNYIKSKWNGSNKCKIINQGLKQQDYLFPYYLDYDIESIKEFNDKSNVIKTPTYTKNQISILVNSFIEKSKQILETDLSTISGYKDVQTILNNFQGGGFELIDEEKKEIGFELYHRKATAFGANQYVLYLYDDINQTKTEEYIRKKHTGLLSSQNIFILTKKPHNFSNPEERIKNIKSKFKIDNVYFINDFIWQNCTSESFKEKIEYPQSSFVEPFLKKDTDEKLGYNYIEEWLISENDPILVLKGSGGIGKTTVAKSVSNLVYKKYPFSNVVFINSQQIVNELIKLSQQNERIDLYKFYVANHESLYKDTEKVNSDIFRLNIDNGNILLIIDGLDEVISRLWNYFDINDFFQSIYDYTKEIGNGKVLITCRNYFWDKSNPDKDKFDSLEILPFNEEKAKIYFRKHYPNSEKLVNKGISLAKELIGTETSNEYIPFVLDQVKIMIDDKADNQAFKDPTFNSKILNHDILNDYIIFKICYRDIKRISQTSVDEQINTFIDFALHKEFNNELDAKIVDKYKGHSLINAENNNISFKYDFFESHFKNIYLSQLITNSEKKINIAHIKILADYVRYNSAFVSDICERIPPLNEETKFRFVLLISEIINFDETEVNEKLKNKAISGLFLIALKKLHLTNGFNTDNNTELLKSLFQDNGQIKHLSIINLTASDNKRIIFDFSDLFFENSYFSNYEYFWECKFGEKTYFNNCFFYDLYKNSGINTSANDNNFNTQTCHFDKSFSDVLKQNNQLEEDLTVSIIEDLETFLKIFLKGEHLGHMPIEKVNAKHIRKAIRTKDMIKILSKSLIETYNHPVPRNSTYVRVKKEYHEDVVKFLTSGTAEQSIKIAINELKELKK